MLPCFTLVGRAGLAFALLALFGASRAAVVVDALPYAGVPGWTDVVFSGTTMLREDTDRDHPGGESTLLTTEQARGVWFGWADFRPDLPGWRPGSSLEGNYVRVDAQFGESSLDWSTYLYDETYHASILYAPSVGCDAHAANNTGCYGRPRLDGVLFGLAEDDDPYQGRTVFVPLDLQQNHTYEALLRKGSVAYHVDGVLVASGRAARSDRGVPIVVIGDGSGSSLTGQGFMRVSRAVFDNAPTLDAPAGQTRANVADQMNPAGTDLEVAGSLQNVAGARLRNLGGLAMLGGGSFLNMAGATLENGGTLQVLAGGAFRNEGSVFGLPLSAFRNAGQMNNAAAGLFRNEASLFGLSGSVFTNAGSVEALPGSMFGLSGTYLGTSGSRFLNQGRVELGSGAVFSSAGSVVNEGAFRNDPGATLENAAEFINRLRCAGPVAGESLLCSSLRNAGVFRNAVGGQVVNDGDFLNTVEALFENQGRVINLIGPSNPCRALGNSVTCGVLRNAGAIRNLLTGQMEFQDGRLENLSGGRLTNEGTLFGRPLASILNQGLITNSGRFQTDAGSQFVNSGTFRNLGGGLGILGGSFVNDSPNTLDNQGALRVTGVLTNTATGVVRNSGALEIAADGRFVNEGRVDNSGTVTSSGNVDLSALSRWSGSGSFLQMAGESRVDGLMEGGSLRFEGGRVTGTGTLRSPAPVIVGAGAVLGGRFGMPVLDADLTLSGALDFATPGSFLSMGTHALTLLEGSEIFVTLARVPVSGDDFLLVDAAGVTGAGLARLRVTGGGAAGFALDSRGGDLYLVTLAPVPEPGSFVLAGGGLVLLWSFRRGRRPGRT